MKSVIIVDAEPYNCSECPFNTKYNFCLGWVFKIDSNSVDYNEDIANGCSCPLRPMPNKMIERGKWISEEYQKGWNAYHRALGDTE